MSATIPSSAELLNAIAAIGPAAWFPASQNLNRDAIDVPLTALWQAGLIEASDWVKGKGQGFTLTAEGQVVAKEPALLAKVLAGQSIDKLKPVEEPPRRTVGPTTFDRGEAARRALLTPPPLLIMPIFVVVNVAVFLVGFFMATKSGPGRLAYLKGEDAINLLTLGGLTADSLLQGQGWRLAASPFLHAGIIHLLINMYTLVVIGSLTEDFWGRWRFIVIYLGSALAGGCLGIGLRPDAILVGASGATSGLTIAVAVWIYLHRQHFDSELTRSFTRQMVLMLVLNAVLTFSVPRVCWEAHLGGAIAGGLLALSTYYIRPNARKKSLVATAVTLLLLTIPIPLLMATIFRSDAWQLRLQMAAASQQYRYLREHSETLQSIGFVKVQGLSNQSLVQMTKSLQSPKLAQQAKDLSAAAATAIQVFHDSAPTGMLSRKMPAKATRYAEAVKALADILDAVLSGKSDDVTAVASARKAVDEAWVELNAHPGQ